MSGSDVVRRVVLGAAALLVLTGVLAGVPAEGDPGGESSWTSREDATSPGSGTTYSWTGADLHAIALGYDGVSGPTILSVGSIGPTLTHQVSAVFTAPTGQTLQAGATYPVFVGMAGPTATAGQLLLWRDDTICGTTRDELSSNRRDPEVARGTFHITELELDGNGRLTRFAATYVVSCQTLGGQPGLEGSIAVNALAPPSVPDAPVMPAAVTGLTASNKGPDRNELTTTTLSWHNPVGAADVVIDMVQSTDSANLPALVGTDINQQFVGSVSQYVDRRVESNDTRTYRVVPRGAGDRLGSPSYVTVQGTQFDVTDWMGQTITIGQEVHFSGRLTLRLGTYAEGAKLPGLAGRLVVMCARSTVHYSDQGCTEIDRMRTSADGRFELSATPSENTIYDFEVPATSQMVGNTLRAANAWVAPVTDLVAPESDPGGAPRLARVADRTAVRPGSVIHFSTVRAPAGSRGLVRLQRYDGHTWRTVVTRRFDTRRSGVRRIAIPYREWRSGRHLYRVVKLGDKRHVNGVSRTVRVKVR